MADEYNDSRTSLPAAYVRFIEAHSGWEGDLGNDLGHVVLWDPTSIQDRWESYQMAEFLGDRWFPFGSDGGDEMLCFDLQSGTDRVFHLPYIGMSMEKPILRYESFSDLASAILKHA